MSSAHPLRLYCLTLSSIGVGPLKRIAQNYDAHTLLACRTMPRARWEARSPHDARRIETQAIAVAQCMFVTSCRRGWTQETLYYSHLEQTRPTRRVITLEWSRQAFEVLLIGSGDGSSRISASACERWLRGVSYTTTGLSHDPRTLVRRVRSSADCRREARRVRVCV